MHELSKSIFHRLKDSRYATRYFVGDGIDVGCGPDPLSQYYEFFPLMRSCRSWDMPDGDAQLLETADDCSFDFLHSSHCLEHMFDANIALQNWLRVVRPGGHLVILIPDEDLYEQGVFPSRFNTDHKMTLTIYKKKSWSTRSVNVFDLISNLKNNVRVKKIELLDATYRYELSKRAGRDIDQTGLPIGESAIEFILQKLAD